MNRSCMYGERATQSFADAFNGFLLVTDNDMRRKGNVKMCCPCHICGNTQIFLSRETLQLHLLTKSFMEGYTRWTCHVEEAEVVVGQGLEEESRHEVAEEYQNRGMRLCMPRGTIWMKWCMTCKSRWCTLMMKVRLQSLRDWWKTRQDPCIPVAILSTHVYLSRYNF
jgi:hypothetical protein